MKTELPDLPPIEEPAATTTPGVTPGDVAEA
jgi:hypothetical protein